MISYTFDLYNEDDYVSSHEKSFESEDGMRLWALSQQGHPFLTYTNFQIKEGTNVLNK
jgi:hypothetical protein